MAPASGPRRALSSLDRGRGSSGTSPGSPPQRRVERIEQAARRSGARVVRGGPYATWDLELSGGALGAARVLVAVEEHGRGRQLVRSRVWQRFTRGAAAVVAGCAAVAVLSAAEGSVLLAIVCATVTVPRRRRRRSGRPVSRRRRRSPRWTSRRRQRATSRRRVSAPGLRRGRSGRDSARRSHDPDPLAQAGAWAVVDLASSASAGTPLRASLLALDPRLARDDRHDAALSLLAPWPLAIIVDSVLGSKPCRISSLKSYVVGSARPC